MSKPNFLTVKELAAETECDRRTISRALLNGQIKGTRLGRNWKIPASELDRIKAGSPLAGAASPRNAS